MAETTRGRDGDSSCDATWVNDVTVKFMDLTFGCEVEQAITVTCEWNADGGRAVGAERAADGGDQLRGC